MRSSDILGIADSHSFAAAVILTLAIMSTGCGSSNIPVTGEVTYQGKPLSNVKVILFGKEGTISQGSSNESGNFTLSTAGLNDGVPGGDYRIAVLPNQPQKVPSTYDASILSNQTDNPIPPKKFHNPDTSGLTCTITSGQEPLKVELK